jgi:hypothetical protein
MRLPCRFCGEHFLGVSYSESWTELDGRHHWIVSPSGLLSGERKPELVRKRKLKTIDLDEFLETEPEVLPETAVQEIENGLV